MSLDRVYRYARGDCRGVSLETFRAPNLTTTVPAVRRFRLALARAYTPPGPEDYAREHDRRATVRRALDGEGL